MQSRRDRPPAGGGEGRRTPPDGPGEVRPSTAGHHPETDPSRPEPAGRLLVLDPPEPATPRRGARGRSGPGSVVDGPAPAVIWAAVARRFRRLGTDSPDRRGAAKWPGPSVEVGGPVCRRLPGLPGKGVHISAPLLRVNPKVQHTTPDRVRSAGVGGVRDHRCAKAGLPSGSGAGRCRVGLGTGGASTTG
jgi:hypothetical protein